MSTSEVERPANLTETRVDEESLHDDFRGDVLAGLACEQKWVPPKHLYDARGSEIFEAITDAGDYYPTRTERSIYTQRVGEIAEVLGPDVTLIEPGAGSGEKAGWLLEAMDRPRAFVPVEISLSAVEQASLALAERFPGVQIRPVCADFAGLERVIPEDTHAERRVIFFPGSTIGNLPVEDRKELLERFARVARPGGYLLIGFDLVKPVEVLERAYDDSEGVTAAFNLNLLTRINRELGGTFDPGTFEHRAVWVEDLARIEMRLVSLADQEVTVGGEVFRFREGEHIHTESSHKFTVERFDAQASEVGFEPVSYWTDERGWFCVRLYRVPEAR